jgi:hypothetical protein
MKKALLAGLAECVAVDVTLLAPALAVRTDLVLEEAACGLAELVVLGLED